MAVRFTAPCPQCGHEAAWTQSVVPGDFRVECCTDEDGD